MDPKYSTLKPEAGNRRRKLPRGKPDQRLGEWRSNKNPNSSETKTVPSKRWYECQTRTKTHDYGELLRGWIRRVKSARASPIMCVKKKDGKLTLCADYRALNEVTKKDRDPLPLISEALDRLGGAKYFTQLDIKDAYDNI